MESGRDRGQFFVRIGGQRWGFEVSPIIHDVREYMNRFIAYAAGYTARLHHILTNDSRGPAGLHNHPFWFVTFPFGDYIEEYWQPCGRADWCDGHDVGCTSGTIRTRTVRGFRFHFRPLNFRHRIIELPNGPVWTFVITGRYEQQWGFFPDGTAASFYPFKPKQGTTNHAPNTSD
jgi:hypothetical protein